MCTMHYNLQSCQERQTQGRLQDAVFKKVLACRTRQPYALNRLKT